MGNNHQLAVGIVIILLSLLPVFLADGCLNLKSKPSSTENPSASVVTTEPQVSSQPSSSNSSGGNVQSNISDRSGSQTSQVIITYGAYALWTGKWATIFFRYGGKEHKTVWELTQVESGVTGTYDWDNGRFYGRQSKTSGLMIGTWSEAPTYKPPDDAGDIEIQQAQDGNSFTGKWRYGSSGDWVGEWNGIRIK